jgi:hypothetical protein
MTYIREKVEAELSLQFPLLSCIEPRQDAATGAAAMALEAALKMGEGRK